MKMRDEAEKKRVVPDTIPVGRSFLSRNHLPRNIFVLFHQIKFHEILLEKREYKFNSGTWDDVIRELSAKLLEPILLLVLLLLHLHLRSYFFCLFVLLTWESEIRQERRHAIHTCVAWKRRLQLVIFSFSQRHLTGRVTISGANGSEQIRLQEVLLEKRGNSYLLFCRELTFFCVHLHPKLWHTMWVS